MHPAYRHATLVAGALLLAACHDDATSPFTARTYQAMSADSGPVPSTWYCSPIASNVDQFVGVGSGSLELKESGRFTLVLGAGYGTQQYHLDATGAKIFEVQTATGQTNYLTGGIVADASGTRRLRWDREMPAFDILGNFDGWFAGDSAVVTVRIDCPQAIGAVTAHTFTVVFR